MFMEIINIITRCTRSYNLIEVKDSIFLNSDIFKIKWHISFDASVIKDLDAELLAELQDENTFFKFSNGNSGMPGNLINDILEEINEDEWIYILDDDNILHERFYDVIYENMTSYKTLGKSIKAYIFSQNVGGKDFSGLDIRKSNPDSVKVGGIDAAQFLVNRNLVGGNRFDLDDYKSDGMFIEKLYNDYKSNFFFIDEVLCHYNYLQKDKMLVSLPRVLVVGEENVKIKSDSVLGYETTDLNIKSYLDDSDISNEIGIFDPDAIISVGDDFNKFSILNNMSSDFRTRWIHTNEIVEGVGESAYQCAMSYILSDKNSLISFFTPFYNTGDKLKRTYDSVKNQIYNNWEWVLVNDSTDGGKTLKIAEEIAKNDPRVKVYDFRKKSGGIIGESKYRSAALCNGKYLMELDHDDYLTNDAALLMVTAFDSNPDCKFVYSDCSEIDESNKSLCYGDGFAFGYGKYKDEYFNGIKYDVAITPNINPKTIRHIVGVPNHFRAWDREFYFSIGGHNRRLSIADDYELIIRSFLKTVFLRIPKLCYLQFYHNSGTLNNTQDSNRGDIQRRVNTISNFYNRKIKDRFDDLRVYDWAYGHDPNYPLNAPSKFGDEEGFVNKIMEI